MKAFTPQITVREKHQITLPASIVRAAHISPSDVLSVEYSNGVITLATVGRANTKRKSLMDYAGCAKGVYGKSTDEVRTYLNNERASWET
jgi:bifunctional DNA-binding transcriptional regulator/antitoxin component of YhaV-PrlF toxin-antitoxin module